MPKLSYTPTKTADRFHLDLQHQIHALVGPWGCGKSQAAIWDVYQYQDRHPEADVLVVRDTYTALADSCVAQWMRTFGEVGKLSGGQIPDFNWMKGIKSVKTGKPITGTVKFRAAQQAWEVQKFLSVEVGMAWLEEATPGITAGGQLSQGLPPELFAGIWARVRQVKEERRLVLTSSPPPNDQHWFHTIFYEGKPLVDMQRVMTGQGEVTLADAGVEWGSLLRKVAKWELPRQENEEHIPAGYYESLLPFLKTEDQVLRFYHGKVPKGSYGGWPVYPMFKDAVHLLPLGTQPEAGPMWRGWDGGLTPACVWGQIQRDGSAKVFAELQGMDEGAEQFVPRAKQLGLSLFGNRPYIDFGDPAIGQRSQNDRLPGTEAFRKHGVVLRYGLQDPYQRVTAVRSWLGQIGQFGIHPRCLLLLAGFHGAYKRKMVSGVPSEVPDKEHDQESKEHSHMMNALEYPATRLLAIGQQEQHATPIPQIALNRYGQWPGRQQSWQTRGRPKTHRGGM